MPFSDRVDSGIAAAESVAVRSADFRKQRRRNSKPGNKRREKELERLLDDINRAMEPVRSFIGRLQHTPKTAATVITPEQEAALRDVSKDLQYQRRQLKKMRRLDPE